MNGLWRKTVSMISALTMIVTICPQMQLVDISAAIEDTEPYCISIDRPVYASSQNGGEAPENAVDGKETTRWQAKSDDEEEWFYVDLGAKADIDHIYIHWESARAKSYHIQFSDDEENWETVYTKGKTIGEPVKMCITSYKVEKMENGLGTIQANWTSVEDATYKVCVDDENTVATAPDGYPFNSHGPNGGQISLTEGKHKLIVIALDKDSGQEIGRGEMDITVAEGASGGQEEESGVDVSKQTITAEELSQKQARYVRINMTERQLAAYGCSFYEFQVWGDNGVVKRPVNYGTNLALNQPVKCSGTRDEWWMYDEDKNLKPDAYDNVKPENAVDGNTSTSFTSYQGDDQWLYVDLGKEYTIGRINVNWNKDAGKMYDVQVSGDAKNWKTVHRVLRGNAEKNDIFTLYQENIRYVRVFGYTKVESGSGFGINELAVYEYREGDSRENETISELPEREIINNPNGKGSYVSGEMYNEKNKLPTFINEDNIKTPIDSNSWWSSAMVQTFSNLLCATPLKASFSKKGLGVLLATAGWVGTRKETDLGTDQSTETLRDFYLIPENLEGASAYDRVEDYGDYSVRLGLMDENGIQMKSTIVKGSPYIFSEFCDNQVAFINGESITEVFDGDGNAILQTKGDEVKADHIGFVSVDEENSKAKNDGTYYCVNVPEGTTLKAMVVGANYKIKVTFPSQEENYMSIAAMTKKGDIDTYYRHGYAFVTDTAVNYTYNQDTSKIVTTYTATTKLMRSGFENVTMHTLFPHQWKHSTDANSPAATYTSVRGDMKAIWSNTFDTTQQFAGLLPTFAMPDSDMFDRDEMVEYLNAVVASKINTVPVDDAYWEGKNVHPLAISIIMADQLGETEIKEKLLKKLKSIMVDWFTYDGGNDKCYLIYNKDWGTVYYPNSAYGANAAICDHHFTYGYFMYGAAVLATYDKQFLKDYKDMVEILVRDYADPMEPEDDGNMFCKFRAFDQYSGHSWAGGYADSDSGNNQESASEALFSWVGMYLWGEATQNQTYIDAGAYGFTTEMDAVEQYWFDYDEDNWLGDHPDREADKVYDYPFQAAGQIYGASMGYGTYFGGQPTYVYGIQWLPISEYLTNYGMNQEKCAKIYQGLEDDTQYAINIESILHQDELDKDPSEWWHDPDTYVTPDNGWQHITWPFLSQTDPQRAYEKFAANVTSVQTEDRANTLWFIAAMDQLGYRTNDYIITGNIQGSVYYNEETKKYTGQVWNPTTISQRVAVRKADGTQVGSVKVAAKGLVSFDINIEDTFRYTQLATPTVKSTALSDGTVKNNIKGGVTFDDTQLIELSCQNKGATIYYTTDGTMPTTQSAVYTDKILVSSDTTIRAMAVKNNYINSSYVSIPITIDGEKIESSENLALFAKATASSENGEDKASKAVDGNSGTMWQATETDNSDQDWIQVDLGEVQAVNTVKINWQTAYASKYQIQVSTDGTNWTTVATENGIAGEVKTTFAATKARYVRMQGLSRGTTYGYAIYDFEVYGALQAKAPTITPVSGVYNESQTVTMDNAVKGSEIKYTTDGSEPTKDSLTYKGALTVDKSTIIKAATYRKGMLFSDTTESSIIIEKTVSINKSEVYVAINRTTQLAAYTNETAKWSSSDTNVATVDQNGLIKGIAKGTAVITVNIPSGDIAQCTVTVSDPIPVESISLSAATLEMKNKSSETLEVFVNPENTTDDITPEWKSSDESVLVVNDNGTITSKKQGTAKVTVKIGDKTAECDVTVGPEASLEEMIQSKVYNLALRKKASLSSIYAGEGNQSTGVLTDGVLENLNQNKVCTDWDGSRTSEELVIDLKQTYTVKGIDQIVMKFVNDATYCENYEIQFSTNGVDYVTVAEQSKTYADSQDGLFILNIGDVSSKIASARFVKIVMKGHKNWGFQILEAAVLSTEQNAVGADSQKCDAPKGVTAKSDKPCELTYTIVADEGQKENGYKYIVYVDGQWDAKLLDAGSYTVTDLEAGTHEIEVYAYYNKLLSDSISTQVYVDDGSLKNYVNTVRNLSKGCDIIVENIGTHDEGSKDPKTLVDGEISKANDKTVQTVYGEKNAVITLDLGEAYDKNEIDEILMAFKEENTTAKAYKISFSGDGNTYQEVISVTGAVYKDALEDKFDASKYNQGTVRYVKIELTDGNVNWGYQISEIAVMGGDSYMPSEPEGLMVENTGDNTIQVTWSGADNGQSYFVYVDDSLKAMNVSAPGTYTYNGIDAGTHIVKVTSLLNDIESKGITFKIEVKGEIIEDDEDIYEFGPDDEPLIGGTSPDEPETTTSDVTSKQDITTSNDTTTSDVTEPGETTKPDVTTVDGTTKPEETTSVDVTSSDDSTEPGETTTPDDTTKPQETTPSETTTSDATTPDEATSGQKELPVAPKGLAYIGVTNAEYSFTWDLSEDAVSYNFYIDGVQIGATVFNGYNVAASDFDTQGEYVIGVTAVDDRGNESEMTTLTWKKPQIQDTTTENTTSAGVTTVSGQTEKTDKTTVAGTTTVTTTTSGAKVSVGKTKVKKVTKKLASGKAKIKLKKIRGAKYQVKVAAVKKFKKKNTVTKKVTKAVFTIKSKKIKGKKILYIKARAYKVVNKKTYFGKWSKVKRVKMK